MITVKLKINKIFESKILNIFISISFNTCFACFLLSIHNICFGWEIYKKNIFCLCILIYGHQYILCIEDKDFIFQV